MLRSRQQPDREADGGGGEGRREEEREEEAGDAVTVETARMSLSFSLSGSLADSLRKWSSCQFLLSGRETRLFLLQGSSFSSLLSSSTRSPLPVRLISGKTCEQLLPLEAGGIFGHSSVTAQLDSDLCRLRLDLQRSNCWTN